ncbi:MAG TPA: winged helix-turn-helix domain-containing protein [Vicinamibacterales bacterium]|nr:winged helix-turn-helix domain-containing protein [Vicinamibacterales bacterium]
MNSTPFGGGARTEVLVALQLLDESYSRELARLLRRSLNGVQMALRGLEREGLIAARPAGRTRVYRLNPRYFARTELAQYLKRLAEPERDLQTRITALRRRPRRSGKPL